MGLAGSLLTAFWKPIRCRCASRAPTRIDFSHDLDQRLRSKRALSLRGPPAKSDEINNDQDEIAAIQNIKRSPADKSKRRSARSQPRSQITAAQGAASHKPTARQDSKIAKKSLQCVQALTFVNIGSWGSRIRPIAQALG